MGALEVWQSVPPVQSRGGVVSPRAATKSRHEAKPVEEITGPGTEAIEVALVPLKTLPSEPNLPQVKHALKSIQAKLDELKAGEFDRSMVWDYVTRFLKANGWRSPGAIVKALHRETKKAAAVAVGQDLITPDPKTWPQPVDGLTL